AQIVDQAEAAFADETGTAGNSGERGRQRGFPGPWHDQRSAVSFRPQPLGECTMVAQGEMFARQVSDDPLAHAWHVVEQRCDHRSGQDINRGGWKSLLQQLNDGVAANEVANPHVRDNQNWCFGHKLIAPFGATHWLGDECKFISIRRRRRAWEAVSLPLAACPAGQDAPGLPVGLSTLQLAEVARPGALGQREGSTGGGDGCCWAPAEPGPQGPIWLPALKWPGGPG